MRTLLAAAPLVALAVAALAPLAGAEDAASGLLDPDALEDHAPIFIHSDAEFTAANGVRRGSGTPADPFVIENWTIVGEDRHGVHVHNARASWVVRNVLVAERANVTDGIWVVNATAGMIDHVEVDGADRFGVYIGLSEGVDVCETVASRNGFVGVYAHRSTNMTWIGNVAWGNLRHGLYLANGSSMNRVTENRAYLNARGGASSYGIYLGYDSHDVRIDNNTVYDNGAGIQVNLVERSNIRDNSANGNLYRGISLTLTNRSAVVDNVVEENQQRGILVERGEENRVESNVVTGHTRAGIELTEGYGHVVTRNTVRMNPVGITVTNGSRSNVIYDNLFSNDQNADDVVGLSRWNVTKRDGPNVVGGPFIGGNYWSDLSTELHDHDEDGLAESHGPYSTGLLGGGDYLPIVSATGAPKAAFTASNDRPDSGERVRFVDATTPGNFPIVNWTWDFGDGSTATGPNATHAYAEAGDYHVVLRVRDGLGLTSASTRVIAVQNLLPVPRVAGDGAVYANATRVRFDATPSHDPDGSIVAYSWTFGDGTTGAGAVVDHTYAGEGHYAASLLVTDNRLGAASLGVLVTVDGRAPVTAAAVEGAPGNGGWVRGPARLALSPFDAGSGVLRTEWRIAGESEWRLYDAPVVLGDGAHEVEYRSVDRAGNAEAARAIRVRADATPPVTAYDGPQLAGPSTPLALAASDAASGAARTHYRLPSDESWRVYEGPFTLSREAEGDVVVRAWSEDAAGNVEPERAFTVLLDRTAPELDVASPGPRSATVDGLTLNALPPPRPVTEAGVAPPGLALVVGEARVRLAAEDALSGLGVVRILVDGALLAEADGEAPEATWVVPPGEPARHVIRAEALDRAGNLRVVEREVWAVPLAPPE